MVDIKNNRKRVHKTALLINRGIG